MKLKIHETLVVITSALFKGTKGESLTQVSAYRLARLKMTLSRTAAFGFTEFVILDNTLLPTFNPELLAMGPAIKITIADLKPAVKQFDKDEFINNGPSRLEAVLLAQAQDFLEKYSQNFTMIIKLSAGYSVRNMEQIIPNMDYGAIYRMGNPLRREVKFCLTSFYVLPKSKMIKLCDYFVQHINHMSNARPLEYYMYRFLKDEGAQLMASLYPRFEADFLYTGKSSKDWSYRIKENIFNLLSGLGCYAYHFKRSD